MSTELLNRITSNPRQCGGRPCIRGMRIRVKDVLDMLAGGASEEEILADFPYLETDDIRASGDSILQIRDNISSTGFVEWLYTCAGKSSGLENKETLNARPLRVQ